MTKADLTLFTGQIDGLKELMNTQFSSVHEQLVKIETQTTKTNGRVNELEKREIKHNENCPQSDRLRKIEDTQLTSTIIKRWIIGSVGITGTVMSILWIVIKLVWG